MRGARYLVRPDGRPVEVPGAHVGARGNIGTKGQFRENVFLMPNSMVRPSGSPTYGS